MIQFCFFIDEKDLTIFTKSDIGNPILLKCPMSFYIKMLDYSLHPGHRLGTLLQVLIIHNVQDSRNAQGLFIFHFSPGHLNKNFNLSFSMLSVRSCTHHRLSI